VRRVPPYRARHHPARPRLGLRPAPGTERAELGLRRDRHPGWDLLGLAGREQGDEDEGEAERQR
jgi:hypothetical protein